MTTKEIAEQARADNKALWAIRDAQKQRILELLATAPDKKVGSFTKDYDPDSSSDVDIIEASDDDGGLFPAYLFGVELTDKGRVRLSAFGVKYEEHDWIDLSQLDPASISLVAVFVADELLPETQPA